MPEEKARPPAQRRKDSFALRFSKRLYCLESIEKVLSENRNRGVTFSEDKEYRIISIKAKEAGQALELANRVFAFNRSLRRNDED
ncbi:MAG: hypothetical protein NT088_03375 [Candidatus Omnitrophica bacterium]|nr:hypothetical protein [Candidatus Omnitrophota bacterium]